jgi:hypothetical protein
MVIGKRQTKPVHCEKTMQQAPASAADDEADDMSAALSWDALLAEFRALGGTAQNVTLRQGLRGRGIFPLNPEAPVRLHLPPNLLVRAEDTEIRDCRLVVKASAAVGVRERAFFDSYQQDFSWGAGVFDHLWQAQLAWSHIPQDVQRTLREIQPVSAARFSEPSEDLCHKAYIKTRAILYRNARVVMPMIELINHGGKFPGYDVTNGIQVGGVFAEEVLVNYGAADCWSTAVGHGFCDAQNSAYSLPGNFKFEDCRIEIARAFDQVERFNDLVLPIVRVEEGTVRFPFLTLGNATSPHLPRAVFLHVTKNTPIMRPDALFDLIQHYNRLLLLKFLRRSEGAATPLVATLRGAAYQQLETLSSNWGTPSLPANAASP